MGAARKCPNCLFTVLLLACALMVSPGCQSTNQKGTAPFASVNIAGNTPGQIRPAAIEVFQQHGYQLARTSPNELVFEKPGTRWSNLAYGNWLDTATVLRVKLQLSIVAETDCRLDCRAFVVRDPGSATEEELQLTRIKTKPYEAILEEIAARFRHKTP